MLYFRGFLPSGMWWVPNSLSMTDNWHASTGRNCVRLNSLTQVGLPARRAPASSMRGIT